MSDMKRCIDCKHCWWPEMATGSDHLIGVLAACQHPEIDRTYGGVTGVATTPCWLMRQHRCGDDAVLFEPRKRDLGM